MNHTQVIGDTYTFTPEETESRFEEIVPPTAVRVSKHTSSDVQAKIRLSTVENIARAISSPETIDTRRQAEELLRIQKR